MSHQITPADRLLKRFGVDKLSEWTGRHRSRVHAWTWPTEKGGTGGIVPVRVRPGIIVGAKRDLNEDVDPTDFELRPGEAYRLTAAA